MNKNKLHYRIVLYIWLLHGFYELRYVPLQFPEQNIPENFATISKIFR